MKLIPILSVVALLASVGSLCADHHELRKEIEAAEQKWNSLFNANDLEGISQLYVEDAQSLQPEMGVLKGREAILANLKKIMGDLKKTGRVETATTLDVIGQGNFATETGLWVQSNKDGSEKEEGTYIWVWKKVDGYWKVYRETWNVTNKRSPELVEELSFLKPLLGTWEFIGKDGDGNTLTAAVHHTAMAGGHVFGIESVVTKNGKEVAFDWRGLINWNAREQKAVYYSAGDYGFGSGDVSSKNGKIVFEGVEQSSDGESLIWHAAFSMDGESGRVDEVLLSLSEKIQMNWTLKRAN